MSTRRATARFNAGATVYAHYIGRIGVVAVALGVGAAVATGCGVAVARADDDTGSHQESTTTDSSADPSADTSAEPTSPKSAEPTGAVIVPTGSNSPAPGDIPGDAPETAMNVSNSGGQDTSVKDEGQHTDTTVIDGDLKDDTPAEASTLVPNVTAPTGSHPDSSHETEKAIPETALRGDALPAAKGDDDDQAGVTAFVSVDSGIVRRLQTAPESTGDDDISTAATIADELRTTSLVDASATQHVTPAVDLPTAIVGVAVEVVRALLSPVVWSGPDAPAEPPLVWALLAFVRREIGRTFFNQTPDAVADQLTTSQGIAKTIDILANDTDDDPLTITGYTQAGHGTVVLNGDNTFTYTPTAGFQGNDSFTYTLGDAESRWHLHGFFGLFGGGHTDTATVSITVTGADGENNAPTNGRFIPGETDPATGRVTGTVRADDEDGDTLTYTLTSAPASTVGGVTVDVNTGALTFAPTDDARYAASLTDGDDPVDVVVAASDGQASTSVNIRLVVSPRHPDDDGRLSMSELTGMFERGEVDFVENADGTVRFIDGRFTNDKVLDSADAAAALNRIAEILGARTGFADEEGIAHSQLLQTALDESEVTQHFYRLRQTTEGVQVLGSEVVLVTDADGYVTSVISSNNAALATVNAVPSSAFDDAAEAVSAASAALVNDLGGDLDAPDVDAFLASLITESDLVVDARDRDLGPRLVWRVHISNIDAAGLDPAVPVVGGTYYVFANGTDAGTVYKREADIESASTQGAASIRIYRASDKDHLPGTPVTDESPQWDDSTAAALRNVTKAYEYYLTILGRDSYNGFGSDIIVSVYGNDIDNAWWHPVQQQISFGGDLEKALDAVGHELTHGVISYIVGDGRLLTLEGNLQADTLNEAYSDIMGSLIEGKSKEEAGRWWLGEGSLEVLRSMSNPSAFDIDLDRDPDTEWMVSQPGDMRDYIKSVPGHPDWEISGHVNVGIFTHAAYTMMTDPDAAGVSDAAWARLFYDSMYRLPSDATFLDARAAVISSAKALKFTPDQQAAVADGFSSVGIEDPDYVRIILRWDQSPDDLDAHLVGPSATGDDTRFHVYYGSQAYFDDGTTNSQTGVLAADLDGDDVDRLGPERITIREMTPGEYTFVVEDFSNRFSDDSTALARSGAYVKVYDGPTVNPAVFRVDGTSAGTSWSVFKLTITADHSVRITPINQYGYTASELGSKPLGVVLQDRYGSTTETILNASGTRAIAISNVADTSVNLVPTEVTFINAITGKPIGNGLVLADYRGAEFNPSGTRAVVVSYAAGADETRVDVYDTNTFNRIGSTVVVPGAYDGSAMQFDSTGTRLTISSNYFSVGGGAALIDLTTGNQVFAQTAQAGERFLGASLSADGRRVLFYTQTTTSAKRLTVFDAATGAQIGSTEILDGLTYSNPDGSRMVIVNSDYPNDQTQVQVINTVAGTQVGVIRTLAGVESGSGGSDPIVTANGRAIIATVAYQDTPGILGMTRLYIVDTNTGAQIGSVVERVGAVEYTLVSVDGARAVIAGHRAPEGDSTPGESWVMTVDTATGSRIGTLFTAPEGAVYAKANTTGTRVTIAAEAIDPYGAGTTTVYAINTTTGQQIGQPLVLHGAIREFDQSFNADGTRAIFLTGNQIGGLQVSVFDATVADVIGTVPVGTPGSTLATGARMSPDGTRAAVTYLNFNGTTFETRVVTINAAIGSVIGNTITIPGQTTTPAQFALDGSRIILSGYSVDVDNTTGTYELTTRAAIIDAATGSQIGNTITSAGGPYNYPFRPMVQLSPDGTRGIITTYEFGATGRPENVRMVVVDTVTGRQIGDAIDVSGQLSGLSINAGSTRAAFAASVYAPATPDGFGHDAQVIVVDLLTGA